MCAFYLKSLHLTADFAVKSLQWSSQEIVKLHVSNV